MNHPNAVTFMCPWTTKRLLAHALSIHAHCIHSRWENFNVPSNRQEHKSLCLFPPIPQESQDKQEEEGKYLATEKNPA